MAFTIGREITIFGNKRVALLSCSVDSTSGNVDTGLSQVDGFSMAIISMTSQGVHLTRNVGSNSTARPGIINLQSFTTGDVFFLTVYGK